MAPGCGVTGFVPWTCAILLGCALEAQAHGQQSLEGADQVPISYLTTLGGGGFGPVSPGVGVSGTVLDALAIAPSSPQLTEGFGEELAGQQAMLQQMQRDIAYQELMVSKAEDYAKKLASKIQDDKEILKANKGIFESWRKAVQKNAANFEEQINNLHPTGEGYARRARFRRRKRSVRVSRRTARTCLAFTRLTSSCLTRIAAVWPCQENGQENIQIWEKTLWVTVECALSVRGIRCSFS